MADNFVKIKLTFMARYDFGQSSKARVKEYVRLPFAFIRSDGVQRLPSSLRWGLLRLVLKALSIQQDSFFCSRSDLHLTCKTPFNVALQLYIDSELIEILDDTLLVKRREEKRRKEERREDSEEKRALKKELMPTADQDKPDLGKITQFLIARYCELWGKKYPGKAIISGKHAGIFKTLARDHSQAKAVSIIDSFLAMNERYFVQRRHDPALIPTSLTAIAQFQASGKEITQTQLNQLDRTMANKSAVEEAAEFFRDGGKS